MVWCVTMSVALLVGCVAGPRGTTQATRTVDSSAVGDFDRLVELVEAVHPDPFTAFGGPDSFEAARARFRAQAVDLRTPEELHSLAQRFLATLRDGHTSMSALSDGPVETSGWAPLSLGIASDGMFVRNTVPELGDWIGGRLLAVNDLPLAAVLDSLSLRTPVENGFGAMEQLRRLLDRRRSDWPPVLTRHSPVRLRVEAVTGDTVVHDLKYRDHRVDPDERNATSDLTGDNDLLYGRILDRGGVRAGYFRWNAIVSREVADEAYRRAPATSKGTFDWVFSYLPGVERTSDPERDLALMPSLYARFADLLEEMDRQDVRFLIIDLRKNGGGMTPLVYTLLYMMYGDAVIESRIEARYDVRLSPLYLSKIGVSDIDEYNSRHGTHMAIGDFRRGFLFRNDRSLSLKERRNAEWLTFADYGREYFERAQPVLAEPPVVIVLTSPSTFSAAFHFTYFLSEVGHAVTVGVTPRQAPNAFMEATPFTLPWSGLKGSISNAVQILYPAGEARSREFTPDYPMTQLDFAKYDYGPDAEVLYALDLIASGRFGAGGRESR